MDVKHFPLVMEQALLALRRQLEPTHAPSCVCWPCQCLRSAELAPPGLETLCLLVEAQARQE